MNKRIDTIKNLFVAQTPELLSGDNASSPQRVSAGSVKSVKDTFTEIERDDEDLRSQLTSGSVVVLLDPSLIDPSPLTDQFRDDDDASFDAFKQSIADRRAGCPVLVRLHPKVTGRYQCAYGHRRIRATRDLGVSLLRQLFAICQTKTSSSLKGSRMPRQRNLSFIERAIFAMQIEDAGHDRAVIQHALSIDKAEASKLLAVARAVPRDILHAIGKSPKVEQVRPAGIDGVAQGQSRAGSRESCNRGTAVQRAAVRCAFHVRAVRRRPRDGESAASGAKKGKASPQRNRRADRPRLPCRPRSESYDRRDDIAAVCIVSRRTTSRAV